MVPVMELSYLELVGVGGVILITILITNLIIYCLNKRLIARLALNSEREIAQVRHQVNSLSQTVQRQQSALMRLRKK